MNGSKCSCSSIPPSEYIYISIYWSRKGCVTCYFISVPDLIWRKTDRGTKSAKIILADDRGHCRDMDIGLIWLFLTEPAEFETGCDGCIYALFTGDPGRGADGMGIDITAAKIPAGGDEGLWQGCRLRRRLLLVCTAGLVNSLSLQAMCFPSNFLNSDVFLDWFGFPIQLFRSIMACISAIGIISSLRAFEEETRRRIESLSQAQRCGT